MKRPAFQFYPSDWRRDAALQSCSIAARGMWIELMCVMHDCDPYGVLSINGKAMTTWQIARLVGEQEKLVGKLIAELEGAGVCSRDDDGRLFSRRMVRDEVVRNARAAGGSAGAEHGIKGASHGAKGGRPRKDKAGSDAEEKTPLETPLTNTEKPPPSSSSSSSSSTSTTSTVVEVGARKRAAARPDDVAEPVWQDFQRLRAQKRAPLTDTALAGLRREADKAGIGLGEALAYCCEQGWQGFNAGWYAERTGKQARASPPAAKHAAAARAIFGAPSPEFIDV